LKPWLIDCCWCVWFRLSVCRRREEIKSVLLAFPDNLTDTAKVADHEQLAPPRPPARLGFRPRSPRVPALELAGPRRLKPGQPPIHPPDWCAHTTPKSAAASCFLFRAFLAGQSVATLERATVATAAPIRGSQPDRSPGGSSAFPAPPPPRVPAAPLPAPDRRSHRADLGRKAHSLQLNTHH